MCVNCHKHHTWLAQASGRHTGVDNERAIIVHDYVILHLDACMLSQTFFFVLLLFLLQLFFFTFSTSKEQLFFFTFSTSKENHCTE